MDRSRMKTIRRLILKQRRSRYIMPAYGGLYAPLDDAAAAAFRQALGPGVEIVPIDCAETQRRAGAVHCSCSAYPKD